MASVSICQAICPVFEPGVMHRLRSVDNESTRDLTPLRRGWPCENLAAWERQEHRYPGGRPRGDVTFRDPRERATMAADARLV